ncbi:hypothetical protein BS50DRAFT_156631 [Corynespora cassiicola Philippines]|uniref:Uncharacterized protein n=1 Tax=Corynespora cassiicola Philippines TaxID=1448308 RepID=A0A2T2N715_CORCC|nr:hypothetical protein BS50DRAFT_156631 [Corynespora cassiicola Philippines]
MVFWFFFFARAGKRPGSRNISILLVRVEQGTARERKGQGQGKKAVSSMISPKFFLTFFFLSILTLFPQTKASTWLEIEKKHFGISNVFGLIVLDCDVCFSLHCLRAVGGLGLATGGDSVSCFVHCTALPRPLCTANHMPTPSSRNSFSSAQLSPASPAQPSPNSRTQQSNKDSKAKKEEREKSRLRPPSTSGLRSQPPPRPRYNP